MLSRASHDAHPSTSGAVIACAVLSLLIPGLGQFLQLRSGAAFGFFLAAFVMDLLLLPIGLIVHLLAAAECVQNAPS